MRNLAGSPDCDHYIDAELSRAKIDLVHHDAMADAEVRSSITGRLGAFSFKRAWRYYIASGPFPLDVAERLYIAERAWRSDVRAGGHCACPEPRTQATYFDADGKQRVSRAEEADFMAFAARGDGIGAHIREAIKTLVFVEDPAAGAHRSIVDTFHIDSELGLWLFADAVEKLP
ncbi:MAG TPA: hypothetical protein VGI39_01430 [Polyangiaceae bacterium]|jgi:hypothetical protein